MHCILARSLIVVGLCLATSQAAAENSEWRFTALLDGKPIGHHHFKLVENGTSRELTSEARFNVKLLFVSVYKYVHDDTEVFQGDCLQRIDAKTNDNGAGLIVNGALESQGFKVSDGKQTQILPACIMTFAYWNPHILEAKQLLNSQTGKFERVSIAKQGEETLTARGKQQPAVRYLLSGEKLKIELWYSPDSKWLGLQSTTEEGRKLRYQLE